MTVFAESVRADIYTCNSELIGSATPVAELEALVTPSSVGRCSPEPARFRCVRAREHSRFKGQAVPCSFHYATHCKPLNGESMNKPAAQQNPYPELDAVYTPRETAKLLKISRKTVAVLIKSGALEARKAGSRVLIPRAGLIAYLDGGQK